MRAAVRRALESPPPRGAVVVVAVGLLVSIAAVLLTRDAGTAGADVPYVEKKDLEDSAPQSLGAGGETRIVDGVLSYTGPNDDDLGLYRIENSLRVNAGRGGEIRSINCELDLPRGVHIGQSEGRRAAFPRPLADTGDDAIKEGAPVEFETGDDALAGVELRNAFFKYNVGGDPSVEWPSLEEGHHVWLWRYPMPVPRARVNFAVIVIAKGEQTVRLGCRPLIQAGGITAHATARTTVGLPLAETSP